MIADLKPYAEYKESGLPWLGQVPGHWETRRAKFLLREVDSRSRTGGEQLLRVSQYTGVTQRKALDGSESPDTRAASLVGYKRVQPNDLVINIMLAWNGSMGVSRYDGIASPAYCVYRFNENALPWYFHELLRTPAYKQRIKTASTGVVESRLRLYSDDFGRIELPLPPLDEQAAIVRFLDWANGRLDRAIRAKRKVIALLNEQKQAIIHRAVTRGLDPSVPLKPSGIPWLGDIPQHWEVVPLSAVTTVVDPNPSHRNPTYTDGGFPFISTVEFVGDEDILLDTSRRVAETTVLEQERRCAFREGSIAFSRKGTIGATRVLPCTVRFALLDSVCVINCRERMRYRYLFRQLGSGVVTVQLGLLARGAALKQVSVGRVRNTRILLPPVEEQEEIETYLEGEVPKVRAVISRLEREIELLREYRTRLVADVVTGKLDVCEAAARLPDEAPVDTVEDDADLGDEAEASDKEDAA